ncbi:MAG: D-alanine--D-alanine ligase [Clostridia bacterium]|nr:D-alanine--D-alanine ligase [Clostridia bacterium]
MKTKVAVLFGGHSVEHEVSIISGLQAFAAFDREKYDVLPIYISKDNRFYTGEALGNIEIYKDMTAFYKTATRVLLVPSEKGVDVVKYPAPKFGKAVVDTFEVAVPVVHGTNVEDGTLMGYLEMLGVPYASCDVTASALGMDKFLMKAALENAGIPVLPAKQYRAKAYALAPDATVDAIESAFGYPVIVKPVNLGSSVGISKADTRDALVAALDLAVSFADTVLVERAVSNLREINCSVLGDADEAIASVCEEPLNATDILSFSDKYLSGGDSKTGAKTSGGMSSLKRRCPAQLPDGMTEKVQQMAVDTFKALGCMGVSRIDFLNDTETGEIWVNEINTIPGSLSFYLWEAAGVPFAELMDRLVALAFKRARDREALTFTYESNILAGFGGAKGSKGKA